MFLPATPVSALVSASFNPLVPAGNSLFLRPIPELFLIDTKEEDELELDNDLSDVLKRPGLTDSS